MRTTAYVYARNVLFENVTEVTIKMNLSVGRTRYVSGAFLIVLLGATLTAMNANAAPATKPDLKLVLLGASIGQEWRFDKLPTRAGLSGYRFEYQGVNAFDKGPLVDSVLAQSRKPDYVLIKECSTYFPGDQALYQERIVSWVLKLRAAGVRPVLVTAAPVEPAHNWVHRTKDLAKRAIGRSTWADEVMRYNDWLRDYARRENIPLFDLEAVLRIGPDNRYLRPEYGIGDYVHINDQAYRALDREFVSFLRQLSPASH